MHALSWVLFAGLLGGMVVGLQAPLSSMIGQRLGPFESVFIIHLGGAIAALLPLALMGGGKLGQWHLLPWYVLGAGVLGLVFIASITITIPRIGATGAIVLVIAGQMLMACVLDHFGWLDMSVRPISWQRLSGLALMAFGIWLVIKA